MSKKILPWINIKKTSTKILLTIVLALNIIYSIFKFLSLGYIVFDTMSIARFVGSLLGAMIGIIVFSIGLSIIVSLILYLIFKNIAETYKKFTDYFVLVFITINIIMLLYIVKINSNVIN